MPGFQSQVIYINQQIYIEKITKANYDLKVKKSQIIIENLEKKLKQLKEKQTIKSPKSK